MPLPARPALRLAACLVLLASGTRAEDVLPRWREAYPRLHALTHAIEPPLIALESPTDPLPDLPDEWRTEAQKLARDLAITPADQLGLDPVHGPETPFPDHQPLRNIAALRAVLARLALADGDVAGAWHLVGQNLLQARATLRAQEGVIPLIHALAVWQAALDGVQALARAPHLPPGMEHRLLAELQADATLAQDALVRAMRGEYLHVFKVIVERMPVTDDPDLFLSSVASLGMAPPEALEPGELGLGLTEHRILDTPATLAAYEADLATYFETLRESSRFPRGLHASSTGPTLRDYARQLGPFYHYATGELPPTLTNVTLARAALESTPNPGGKLLANFLTPQWEMFLAAAARREAQRSALLGLLAWRIHGGPTPWEILVARGVLPAAPADPFSEGDLVYSLGFEPRVWSVFLNGTDDGGRLENGNSGLPEDLVWHR